MQISNPLPAYKTNVTAGPASQPTRRPSESAGSTPERGEAGRINFSHITPRQLHAYVDDMIKREQIDPDDAGALFGSIPLDLYTECPDSPINLKETINGIAEFDRRNGYDSLAVFYEGLAARMNLMEHRSLPVSVMA